MVTRARAELRVVEEEVEGEGKVEGEGVLDVEQVAGEVVVEGVRYNKGAVLI